jgi:hypothetical protein
MMFLLRYGKVLAISVAVAAVLVGINRCCAYHERRGYDLATAEMSAKVSEANARTAALEQRQREQSQKAAQAWEIERNELESKVAGVLAGQRPVVRLCKPAPSGGTVPGAAAATASADEPAKARVDVLLAGPDIGVPMVQYGAECERYRAQLKALQEWVASR